MMDIDGVFIAYTLEPRMDKSNGKPFAIPAATYNVKLELSPHFKTITPHVLDVPGFEGIEIHWGNFPKDTEGCCLVGETRDDQQPDFIGNSREAFWKLIAILEGAKDAITITYKDVLVVNDFEKAE